MGQRMQQFLYQMEDEAVSLSDIRFRRHSMGQRMQETLY